MRFLCDVHISIKISKRIQELGYDSQHVNFILDRWHSKDLAIAEFANHHDLILISKDQDFRNSFLLSQKPKKFIKISLGNISNDELINIIEKNLNYFQSLDEQSPAFMVEISDSRLLSVTN
jgi:predicted nuclease of predicted toxin-antitoxin system